MFVCELQVAPLTGPCQLRSPPTTRCFFSHLFTSSTADSDVSPPLCASLCLALFLPEHRSILLCTRCRSSVTHFLPLYQELIPSCLRSYDQACTRECRLEFFLVQVESALVTPFGYFPAVVRLNARHAVIHGVTTSPPDADLPHENTFRPSQMRSSCLFPGS